MLFILIVTFFTSICFLWRQIKKQRKFRVKLDKSLDGELLSMLGGDKKAALRLLRHARKNNPGRSYLWYHEKVIADLERDRRCR